MTGLFIVTDNDTKIIEDISRQYLITFVALMFVSLGAIVSGYNNWVQSKEIKELRSRIDIMEVYFPIELPDRSWK